MGALLQILVYAALGRLSLAPTLLYLSYTILDTYAQSVGFIQNRYLKPTIPGKTCAQYPERDGTVSEPAGSGVTVLLIGTRTNHPLGLLAPGAKDLGDFFQRMARDLDEHAEEFGFLGMTSWLNAAARQSHNEIMSVAYFRTTEGLHAFAHSKYHRDGWSWWTKTYGSHPHLSIFHEVYAAPRGGWENIYVNSHASGFASTTFKVEGEEKWVSPVVDASRGALRTSKGRLGRTAGKENEVYGQDPY